MTIEDLGSFEKPEEGKFDSTEQVHGLLIEKFLAGTQPFKAQRFTVDDLIGYFGEHASENEKMSLSEHDIKSGIQWLAEQNKIGHDGTGEYWIKESA